MSISLTDEHVRNYFVHTKDLYSLLIGEAVSGLPPGCTIRGMLHYGGGVFMIPVVHPEFEIVKGGDAIPGFDFPLKEVAPHEAAGKWQPGREWL